MERAGISNGRTCLPEAFRTAWEIAGNDLEDEPEARVHSNFKELATSLRLLKNLTHIPHHAKENSPSVGTRKPDVITLPPFRPSHEANIISLIEIKKVRAQFSKEHLGELLSKLIELLEDFQPHRSEAYGFVTDLIHIQFLRVYRSTGLQS